MIRVGDWVKVIGKGTESLEGKIVIVKKVRNGLVWVRSDSSPWLSIFLFEEVEELK